MNLSKPKTKVNWEIDSKLLEFIRLLRKLEKRENQTEADYANALLAFAIGKILKIDELKKPK